MRNRRSHPKKVRGWTKCMLCGRPLPQDPGDYCVGKTGRGVCYSCLQVAFRMQGMLKTEEEEVFCELSIVTPREIIARLDRAIIGQQEAKRAVAVALWKQQLRARRKDAPPNAGLLLYGPTGCGKTALVREAVKAAGLPFLCFDATTLTEAGYRGRDARELVEDLIDRYGEEAAAAGVIYLDEVDKLAARGGETRAQYQRGTHTSLLKLIEGSEVLNLDTSNILFLFGGAFPELTRQKKPPRRIGFGWASEERAEKELRPEDFVAYGMEPELMGRIGRCVPLHPLTESDLRRILLESELSVYRQYQAFFHKRGQEFELDAQTVDELIRKTLARGMGARGLNALVEEWMEPKLLEIAEVTT